MKDIPIIFSAPMVLALLDGHKTMTRRLARKYPKNLEFHNDALYHPSPWARVEVGDRLWAREGFTDTPVWWHGGNTSLVYAADWPDAQRAKVKEESGVKWRPSIHMPRNYSRLTLVVTAKKIERLHRITAADVRAEGIPEAAIEKWRKWLHPDDCPGKAFGELWDLLHGPGSWEANPEVVALSFTVHAKNIDAMKEAA